MNNLPPGVSESMIPGNRPEDAMEEKFWDLLIEKAEQAGIGESLRAFEIKDDGTGGLDWYEDEHPIVTLVNIARELEYNRGFDEGKSEGIMSMAPDEPTEGES